MLNRYVAVMLMTGLAVTSIRADYYPQGEQEEQVSRYELVEMDSSWDNPASDLLYKTDAMYPFQSQSPSQNNCHQLTVFNSACIVNKSKTRDGLKHQIQFLKKYPSYRRFADQGVNLSSGQLLDTAHGVLRWLDNQDNLTDRFELVDLSNYGESQTHFTGYYTPEIEASRQPSAVYRFPVYRDPADNRRTLSRAEINNGALEGQNLEIAWVKDPIGLFYIHMQGSGILVFENGEHKVLQFAGSNGQHFKSIASYMQRQGYLNGDLSRRAITAWLQQHPERIGEVFAANPRYVYFSLGDELASSASGMKLIPGHTVAVDTRFIPFGAILLAEVPRIDHQGKVLGYDWRLLFSQDRGNAIKGGARIDFYTGTGEWAKNWANRVTGLRHTYLLLDKSQRSIQTASARSY